METDAMERVDSVRRNVHEWRSRAITSTVGTLLFYVGLAITVLGLVVVAASILLSWR